MAKLGDGEAARRARIEQAKLVLKDIKASHAQPYPHLRKLQHNLPPEQREKVVEFIAEVCEGFGHSAQTAGLSVTYFDRYCSKMPYNSPSFLGFELAATACIFIAAKFLETRVPALDELCGLSSTARTRRTLKTAELRVLKELGWDLHAITPHVVLEQLLVIVDASSACQKRAEFLVDMSFYEHKILEYSPVAVAAAALLLSWNHVGDTLSESKHTEIIAKLCDVDLSVLFRCKHILAEHFNIVFTQSLAAANALKPTCESPVSIFDDLAMAGRPDGARFAFAPVAAPAMGETN